MTKETTAEIICIIDRSGSMQEIRDDAIGSFNSFLEKQKQIGNDALVTIVLFDDRYELIHNATKIANVKPLTSSTYVPRGTTALYDAIGRTIAEIDARLPQRPEGKPNDNITIAILTDGHENSSREFTQKQIFHLIESRTKNRDWDFIYLSADPDAFDAAGDIGICDSNVVHFPKSCRGIHFACDSMSRAMELKRKGKKLDDGIW